MQRLALLILVSSLVACHQAPASQNAAPAAAELRTIESVSQQPVPLDPPPMLVDEMPPPKPKVMPWQTATPIVFTAEDDKVRSSLPFTPAIAMDPLDGSKISIRAATPTFDYKGKIYYFSSEENKRVFTANPEAAIKSGNTFTKL
ncbi:MAG TPA: YHS domain-containing protein [Thermoanaerobaculia bacterium]|jgi:YHS domain-containing protein